MYRARRLVIAFHRGGTALGASLAGCRRFSPTGLLLAALLAGCTSWHPPVPVPPELTEAGVQARLRLSPDPHVHLAATGVRPSPRSHPAQTLAINPGVEPEPAAFSLADAIAFAQQHSPRLRSARTTIERREICPGSPFLEVACRTKAANFSATAILQAIS